MARKQQEEQHEYEDETEEPEETVEAPSSRTEAIREAVDSIRQGTHPRQAAADLLEMVTQGVPKPPPAKPRRR